MALAALLGAFIGKSKGNILKLTSERYDGSVISLCQSKTGEKLQVPVAEPLREALEKALAIVRSHISMILAPVPVKMLTTYLETIATRSARRSWSPTAPAAHTSRITFAMSSAKSCAPWVSTDNVWPAPLQVALRVG